MTDTADVENNSSMLNEAPVIPKRITLYRFKRFFIPIFIGFLTTFVTFETGYCPTLGFFAFIASGLSLDWWYFQYKKYKDSEQVSEELCQFIGITRNQIDELNQYMVTARKASLTASISITAALVLFFDLFNWQATLILSYMGIVSLIVIYGMIAKKIIVPYALDKTIGNQTAPDLFLNPTYHPNTDYSIDFRRDNFDRFDITSSAAYWPGGALDPRKFD
jgi:hypothetical protein